jgi:hypothetical protein
MSLQIFGTTRAPILGLGSLEEKWHLDVVLVESNRIYYKEGSGASFQRLWAM